MPERIRPGQGRAFYERSTLSGPGFVLDPPNTIFDLKDVRKPGGGTWNNEISSFRVVGGLPGKPGVERLPDPDDGRAHLLALTADGRRRLGDARDSRRGRLRDHLATWADGDIRTLATLLAKFNAVPPAGAWSARA